MADRPVITAWSALSPFGYGADAFAAGVRGGLPAPGRRVPGFDIADRLGDKGTGSMDRSTALAVDTVAELAALAGPRTGVVLGTTSGSTRTQFEFTRDSLTRRRPDLVNPAVMPFALMNSAAARCAIWHGLTGPNTTVANGRLSGLVALRYASRLLAAGRADAVVAGAVEEDSEQRALVAGAGPLGEGCAALLLARGGAGLAEVACVRTAPGAAGREREALLACLRGLGDAPVRTLAVGPLWTQEQRDAVAQVYPDAMGEVLDPAGLIGDTGAASTAFQLAALLAMARAQPRWAVVTTVDDDGSVGAALLRVAGR